MAVLGPGVLSSKGSGVEMTKDLGLGLQGLVMVGVQVVNSKLCGAMGAVTWLTVVYPSPFSLDGT